MPNTCGLTVHGLWASKVQLFALTHIISAVRNAWVKTYGFVDSLHTYCTQVLHGSFYKTTSVFMQFYPLSTQPIKTTTF